MMADLMRGLPGGDDLGGGRRFLAWARTGEARVAKNVSQVGAPRFATPVAKVSAVFRTIIAMRAAARRGLPPGSSGAAIRHASGEIATVERSTRRAPTVATIMRA